MAARLEWGEEQARFVASESELELLLDTLHREAADQPFLVELTRESGESMSMGLGRSMTVVDYVPASLDPPYLQAWTAARGGESLWFDFRGSPSEFPPDAAIPLEDGRKTLLHFFATGELSPDLAWRET